VLMDRRGALMNHLFHQNGSMSAGSASISNEKSNNYIKR
jgi:hypothetical protein